MAFYIFQTGVCRCQAFDWRLGDIAFKGVFNTEEGFGGDRLEFTEFMFVGVVGRCEVRGGGTEIGGVIMEVCG